LSCNKSTLAALDVTSRTELNWRNSYKECTLDDLSVILDSYIVITGKITEIEERKAENKTEGSYVHIQTQNGDNWVVLRSSSNPKLVVGDIIRVYGIYLDRMGREGKYDILLLLNYFEYNAVAYSDILQESDSSWTSWYEQEVAMKVISSKPYVFGEGWEKYYSIPAYSDFSGETAESFDNTLISVKGRVTDSDKWSFNVKTDNGDKWEISFISDFDLNIETFDEIEVYGSFNYYSLNKIPEIHAYRIVYKNTLYVRDYYAKSYETESKTQ
jgi:hypothetical protein